MPLLFKKGIHLYLILTISKQVYTIIVNVRFMVTNVKKIINLDCLPKHSMEIIKLLLEDDLLTQKAIIDKLPEKNPRSIRYSVRQLVDKSILIRQANFSDMRQILFGLNPNMHSALSRLKTYSVEKIGVQLNTFSQTSDILEKKRK